MSNILINLTPRFWKDAVPSEADLPTGGNVIGDARTAEDTSVIYIWDGDAWNATGGGGGGDISGSGTATQIAVFSSSTGITSSSALSFTAALLSVIGGASLSTRLSFSASTSASGTALYRPDTNEMAISIAGSQVFRALAGAVSVTGDASVSGTLTANLLTGPYFTSATYTVSPNQKLFNIIPNFNVVTGAASNIFTLVAEPLLTVATGQTWGSFYGMATNTRRRSASDLGTLTNQYGFEASTGHLNTVDAGAVTTNSFGFQVRPNADAGTITNMYGFYFQAPSTGGTLTNLTGFYYGGPGGATNSSGLSDNTSPSGTNFLYQTGSAANLLTGALTTSALNVTGLTASKVVFTDGSKNLTSSGTVALNQGGTGQTTKAPAFDALSPMSASGDLIYGGTSGTGTRLVKGSDGQVLTLVSGLPAWAPAGGSVTYGTDLHWVNGFNGFGSTGTKIGKFSNVVQAVTTNGDITYASNPSNNGDTWTINHAGVYSIFLCLEPTSATAATYGISRNASSLTTNLISLTATEILGISATQPSLENGLGITVVLAISDVIRVQTNGTAMATGGTARQQFWIRRLI